MSQDREQWYEKLSRAVALSGADTVVYVTESYCLVAPRNLSVAEADAWLAENEATYEPHAFAQRHAAGDPAVVEALMVLMFDRTGQPPRQWVGGFTVHGRRVSWEKAPGVEPDAQAGTGRLVDVINWALAHQPDPPLSSVEYAVAAAALDVPLLVDWGPEPERNAPCPCGSGRKFKHCCAAAS